MLASLYLSNRSFAYNGYDTKAVVAEKICQLANLMFKIKNFKEDNELLINNQGFFEAEILPGITVLDVFNDTDHRIFNRDTLVLFNKILGCFTGTTSFSEDEMIEVLDMADKSNCNGLLVFNIIADNKYKDKWQVISNVSDWLKFRREILAKYSENEEGFIADAKRYYENLVFGTRVLSGIREVFKTHIKRTSLYLSYLNDCLLDEYKSAHNGGFWAFLDDFALKYGIEEASREGHPIMFPFIIDGHKFDKDCEPHLKMYEDDFGNRNQHGRIYFSMLHLDDTVVYVGNICKHA